MNPNGIPCTAGRATLATFTDGTQALIVPLNSIVIGRIDMPADGRKTGGRWIVKEVEATP